MKNNFLKRYFAVTLVIFALILSFVSASDSVSFAAEGSKHIMLQCFGWDSKNGNVPSKWYELVADKAEDIGKCGFTLVWLPPCSNSVSQQGYMPTDYYNLGTPECPTFYGTKDQLADCINKLHQSNIKVLADIVINHRCAGKQDENGLWNVYDFPSGLARWDREMICQDDYKFAGKGTRDSGDPYDAAPDVDHYNKKVQQDIIEWMNWLKKFGFDGWRYDYVKGYAPEFVDCYNQATSPDFSVGELWTSMTYQAQSKGYVPDYNQDSHRQQLCNWLDKAGSLATTFDFTTKGVLQQAVSGEYWRLKDPKGKAAGLIGWWPERAVTFIDNHDTGSKQSHWPFPGDKVIQGYAYILTHPGVPCVFWEHLYDWNLKDQIVKLMSIRKKYDLNSASQLVIDKAENNLYVATIDSKVILKLGNGNWSPADQSFKLQASGSGYAVYGK